MSLLKKLLFLIKRPCVILVTGKGRSCAKLAILQVLKPYFKEEKILIFKSDLSEPKELKIFSFLLKKSQMPILVVTHVGEIPSDKDFFAGNREETLQIRKLAGILPAQGFLILNFDDETVRELRTCLAGARQNLDSLRYKSSNLELKNETRAHSLTYGFQERADFQASDINININGTNFKMNYEGNIVPFWLKNLFGKEQIYSALAAVCVGVVKDINLVETSQALGAYQSLPGKMRLIKGIKNSLVLDDSAASTPFSMIEALEILGKISAEGRKIAVLGDVLGIGKYTIEAHQTIGEKVARVSDLLFTIGLRAKFIAQGAKNKGMPEEKIFQFTTVEEAKMVLQNEIKKGDLILVDGSKEMKMAEIVEEIRA